MNESNFQVAMESTDPLKAELAFEEIEKVLSSLTDPCERAALLLRKAELYGKLHRFVEARREIDRALRVAPPNDPDTLFLSEHLDALFYNEEQRVDDAFKRMTALLFKYGEQLKLPELRSIYEDIQQRRGFELTHLLRFEEAVPIFKECLSFEIQPEDRIGSILEFVIRTSSDMTKRETVFSNRVKWA